MIFVDASAFVSAMVGEKDADTFVAKIHSAERVRYSAIVFYETVTALARINRKTVEQSHEVFERYVNALVDRFRHSIPTPSSCSDLFRASSFPTFSIRWIAGTSPAMTDSFV